MRTSLAHCLHCLIVKTSACTYAFINGDTLIYIKLPPADLSDGSIHAAAMLKLWMCVSCAADWTISLVLSYASGFPFFLFFFCLRRPPAQTLHSHCRSFTSCQENVGLKGGGQLACTVQVWSLRVERGSFTRHFGIPSFYASEEFVTVTRGSFFRPRFVTPAAPFLYGFYRPVNLFYIHRGTT